MNEVLKKIGLMGIVPVVVVEKTEDAVPLGRALADGGLPISEITFRTAAAEDAIRAVTGELPDILVGAGTVLTTDQAGRAIKAGAKFIVSPGFDADVVRFCLDAGVTVIPGCGSPTDISAAAVLGLEVVKFFPAEALGGVSMLKAMSGPFGGIKFVPSGGVSPANMNDYLSLGKVHACGGTWIAPIDLIAQGRFDEITRITREAVSIMLGFHLAHLGINSSSPESSLSLARMLAELFGMPLREGANSNFAGTSFEVKTGAGPGDNGHIAIGCNNLPRAAAHLERMGVEIDWSTADGPAGGDPVVVFLKSQMGGFAFHLLQKK